MAKFQPSCAFPIELALRHAKHGSRSAQLRAAWACSCSAIIIIVRCQNEIECVQRRTLTQPCHICHSVTPTEVKCVQRRTLAQPCHIRHSVAVSEIESVHCAVTHTGSAPPHLRMPLPCGVRVLKRVRSSVCKAAHCAMFTSPPSVSCSEQQGAAGQASAGPSRQVSRASQCGTRVQGRAGRAAGQASAGPSR